MKNYNRSKLGRIPNRNGRDWLARYSRPTTAKIRWLLLSETHRKESVMTSAEERKQRLIDKLTREATDAGKIIELGWLSYLAVVIPADAGDVQVSESRLAFFAGAQHLFSSIMNILDPGTEPTEQDLRRMDRINNELDEFVEQMKKKYPAVKI
jgi:hypothetical protein